MKFDEGWVKFFSKEIGEDYFAKMAASIQTQRNDGRKIYPPEGEVFRAFKLCPFESLKVVIVGQDPYHNQGQADGLAFSVPAGIKPPPTLNNVFQELSSSLGVPVPPSGDLTKWAESGILLLNTVLTVEADKPASHRNIGWERFTSNCLKYISDNKEDRIIFCLWGRQAQMNAPFIDRKKHQILKTSHPSPLSVKQGFEGCGHFIHINKATRIWK